jgi:adenine/guanine phosphoribosyltransferase-like PRPP-binding protein
LADLLVQTNQFDSLIHELQNRGGNVKRIICVAHYQGVQFGTTVHSYFELPYASHEKCAFCTETDRPPLQVSSLGAIEDQLRDFDTSTFWEMIASDTKFYKVGHEIMNRTGYHYHFRIPVKNIFSSHLYAISLRLRNALRQKIYPEWIKKIVCVDDPELDAFAKEMAHRLDLRDVDVVRIPRAELKSVTGAIIDKGVVRRLRSVKRELNRQNVLIVDQAAHQFKTVAAIASICKHFESTVLAFGVFVDRVDPALRLAQHLPFSYYVPLYSWQCGPSQPQDCACQKHHIMAKA